MTCVECKRKAAKGGRPFCSPCRQKVMQRAREVFRNMDPAQMGTAAARSYAYWDETYGPAVADKLLADVRACMPDAKPSPVSLVEAAPE